jgi:ferritin-like metal-binding protein YciE
MLFSQVPISMNFATSITPRTNLRRALPKMAKAATSEELRAGFEKHLKQTKGHVERLEQIFKELGEKPTGKKCKAWRAWSRKARK